MTIPSNYAITKVDALIRADYDRRVAIGGLHDERIEQGARALGITEYQMVDRYIKVHRAKINAAAWLSEVIGVDHDKYMSTLSNLGEDSGAIR